MRVSQRAPGFYAPTEPTAATNLLTQQENDPTGLRILSARIFEAWYFGKGSHCIFIHFHVNHLVVKSLRSRKQGSQSQESAMEAISFLPHSWE